MKRGGEHLRSLMLSKNKSGLSAIVATLIIILLVLVAVGIIWVVIRNVLQSGAETIELDQKCRDIAFKSPAVQKGGVAGVYVVTLERSSAGGLLAGVKINFFNVTDNSGVIEFGEGINALESKTKSIDTSTGNVLIGANRFDITPYFVDELGSEQVCSDTLSYSLGSLGAASGGGETGNPDTGICGDSIIQNPNGENPAINEQCDGSNLNGQTCVLLGFVSGTLSCDMTISKCQFDTTSCVSAAPTSCEGNWLPPEDVGVECDGTPLPAHCTATCVCDAGFGPDGAGNCELTDTIVNSGTVGEVFTSAEPFIFLSTDLPAAGSMNQNYINFTGIDLCYQIQINGIVNGGTESYVRLSKYAPGLVSTKLYSIWDETKCGELIPLA